jgi:hypothetical protein
MQAVNPVKKVLAPELSSISNHASCVLVYTKGAFYDLR